ncbi:MAG: hypothetical protein WC621_05010 [Patescibacteria group bacterium]
MNNNKSTCPDCGPNPTPHYLSWFTVAIDWLMAPYTRLLDKLWRRLNPWLIKLPLDKIALVAMKTANALHIGTIVKDLRPDHSLRTRALWEEAKRRGIEIFEFRPFGRSVELMVARYNGYLFVFDGLPRPRGSIGSGYDWMDDKLIMRQNFAVQQIPIARGGMAVLAKKALQIFDEVRPPVIVKPRFGSRSRHTFIHVTTRSQLVQAFYSAQKISPWVLIEEELQGAVYRATVINGRLIGVARRDLPHVLGDGSHTIAELVQIANQKIPSGGDIFAVLNIDDATEFELNRQGLSLLSAPADGQFVTLGQKVNRGLGGITVEVTSQVHTDNIQLFEKIAQVVNDSIIGIDFMVGAINEPWHQQTACGVIECNSLPFIDLHHYPLYGEPRNVAGAVWNLIWPPPPLVS